MGKLHLSIGERVDKGKYHYFTQQGTLSKYAFSLSQLSKKQASKQQVVLDAMRKKRQEIAARLMSRLNPPSRVANTQIFLLHPDESIVYEYETTKGNVTAKQWKNLPKYQQDILREERELLLQEYDRQVAQREEFVAAERKMMEVERILSRRFKGTYVEESDGVVNITEENILISTDRRTYYYQAVDPASKQDLAFTFSAVLDAVRRKGPKDERYQAIIIAYFTTDETEVKSYASTFEIDKHTNLEALVLSNIDEVIRGGKEPGYAFNNNNAPLSDQDLMNELSWRIEVRPVVKPGGCSHNECKKPLIAPIKSKTGEQVQLKLKILKSDPKGNNCFFQCLRYFGIVSSLKGNWITATRKSHGLACQEKVPISVARAIVSSLPHAENVLVLSLTDMCEHPLDYYFDKRVIVLHNEHYAPYLGFDYVERPIAIKNPLMECLGMEKPEFDIQTNKNINYVTHLIIELNDRVQGRGGSAYVETLLRDLSDVLACEKIKAIKFFEYFRFHALLQTIYDHDGDTDSLETIIKSCYEEVKTDILSINGYIESFLEDMDIPIPQVDYRKELDRVEKWYAKKYCPKCEKEVEDISLHFCEQCEHCGKYFKSLGHHTPKCITKQKRKFNFPNARQARYHAACDAEARLDTARKFEKKVMRKGKECTIRNCVAQYPMVPYMWSFAAQGGIRDFEGISEEIVEEIRARNRNNSSDTIFLPTGARCFTGLDSTDAFLEFLMKCSSDQYPKQFIISTFNGSRFDLHFILRHLRRNVDKYPFFDMKKHLLMQGTQILQLHFAGHIFYDANRYISGSLANACTNFRVPSQFTKIEKLEFEGKTIEPKDLLLYRQTEMNPTDFLSYMREKALLPLIEKYCVMDSISLLYCVLSLESSLNEIRVRLGLSSMPKNVRQHCFQYGVTLKDIKKGFSGMKRLRLGITPTLPGYASKCFKNWCQIYGVRLFNSQNDPLLNELKELIDMGAKIGGCSYMNEKKAGRHLYPVAKFDITRMYGYVMMCEEFMYGKLYKTNKYEPDLLGYYKVKRVKCARKAIRDIPFKGKDSLQWSKQWSNESKIQSLSSVDIERILANGGKVEIEYGIVATSRRKVFEDFMKVVIEETMKLDDLKKKGEPYNAALRESLKLFGNALYGKTLEKIKSNEYLDFEDNWDAAEYRSANPEQEIEAYTDMSTGKVCMKVRKAVSVSDMYYLGAMILSYSRNLLFKYLDMIGREHILNVETDGFTCPMSVAGDFINATKADSWKVGGVKLEHSLIAFEMLQKKFYRYRENWVEDWHYICKGVSKRQVDCNKMFEDVFEFKEAHVDMFTFSRRVVSDHGLYYSEVHKVITSEFEYNTYTEP